MRGCSPYTLMSPPFGCSACGEDVLRSAASFSFSAAAAAASSSSFFFLNRVSVIGRKKVHSKEYCLQCWHIGGSVSARMSHLWRLYPKSAGPCAQGRKFEE